MRQVLDVARRRYGNALHSPADMDRHLSCQEKSYDSPAKPDITESVATLRPRRGDGGDPGVAGREARLLFAPRSFPGLPDTWQKMVEGLKDDRSDDKAIREEWSR